MSKRSQYERKKRTKSPSPVRKLHWRRGVGSSLSLDGGDQSDEQTHVPTRRRKRRRASSDASEHSGSLAPYSDGTTDDTEELDIPTQSETDGSSVTSTQKASSPPLTRLSNQHKKTRSAAFLPRKDTDAPPAIYYGSTSPPRLPRPMGDFIEIYQTANRGRGVRTTVDDIPQGTILYSEQAAIHVPSYHNEFESDFNNRVRGKVAALKPAELASFIALSHDGSADTEEARFARNCFEDRDPESEWFAGIERTAKEELEGVYNIWLDMAMLNHSCRPNAIMLIRDSQAMIADLITTVDIPVKGTEVTISYLREADAEVKELGRDERRAMLQRSWRFDCDCEACGKQESSPKRLTTVRSRSDDEDARRRSISTQASSFEDSDSRLNYLHNIGQQLGLIRAPGGRLAQPTTETFTRLSSGYEAMLKEERMVYRLYGLHEKAIQVYMTHYCEVSSDELTKSRLLHHREQLNRYSRICYGTEEGQKSAMRYVKDLKGEITKPRVAKGESAVEKKGTKRKRQPPAKPTSTSQMVTRSKRATVLARDTLSGKNSPVPEPVRLVGSKHSRSRASEAAVRSSKEEQLLEHAPSGRDGGQSNDLEVIQHFRRHRRPLPPGRPRHVHATDSDTVSRLGNPQTPDRVRAILPQQQSVPQTECKPAKKGPSASSIPGEVRTAHRQGPARVRRAHQIAPSRSRYPTHKQGGTLTDPIDLS